MLENVLCVDMDATLIRNQMEKQVAGECLLYTSLTQS